MPVKADTALAFLLNLPPIRDLRSVDTTGSAVVAAVARASAAASRAAFAAAISAEEEEEAVTLPSIRWALPLKAVNTPPAVSSSSSLASETTEAEDDSYDDDDYEDDDDGAVDDDEESYRRELAKQRMGARQRSFRGAMGRYWCVFYLPYVFLCIVVLALVLNLLVFLEDADERSD